MPRPNKINKRTAHMRRILGEKRRRRYPQKDEADGLAQDQAASQVTAEESHNMRHRHAVNTVDIGHSVRAHGTVDAAMDVDDLDALIRDCDDLDLVKAFPLTPKEFEWLLQEVSDICPDDFIHLGPEPEETATNKDILCSTSEPANCSNISSALADI